MGRPAGEFMLYAVSPSPDYWEFRGYSITVGTGQAVDAGRLQLSKKLQLLEPGSDRTVTTIATPTPVLRWVSFPGAARYDVGVFNDETGEAVMQQQTNSTSVVVAPPLAAGGRYQWSVNAYDAEQCLTAYWSSWCFRVQV